ncbi:MAG: M16 family metallopeptidase [Candidatus Woesearchaeota archaeon]
MDKNTITLSNKLTLSWKKLSTKTVTILITIFTGSNYEQRTERGISHLLEHVVFEGTQNFPNSTAISHPIESVGGEINAATGKNETMFYAKVPKNFASIAANILYEIVSSPLCEKHAIQKEKNIVCHEIDLYNDDPKLYQWLDFEKHHFQKHPAKKPIAGTKSSVKNITQNQLRTYFQKNYVGQRMHVSVVGNISNNVISQIQQLFSNIPKGTKQTKIPTEISQKNVLYQKQSPVLQTYFIQGFSVPSLSQKDQCIADIIEALLSKGQTGWLFEECRVKRSLAYDVRAFHEKEQTGSYFASQIITEEKYIKDVQEILKELYDRIRNVSEKDVEDAKTYVSGRYAIEQENPVLVAQDLMEHAMLYDKPIEEVLLHITYKDVQRFAHTYLKNFTTSIITPKK